MLSAISFFSMNLLNGSSVWRIFVFSDVQAMIKKSADKRIRNRMPQKYWIHFVKNSGGINRFVKLLLH